MARRDACEACACMGNLGGDEAVAPRPGVRARSERGRRPLAAPAQAQAVSMAAAFSSPSSAMATSRILYFWTFPVTVIGKPSTNL
jgi:hypothetical protein